MPGERLIVRGASEVGRFPGAAPPTRVEVTIRPDDNNNNKKEAGAGEGGGCRRWLRKLCPCCCKRNADTSYDVTDKVEVLTPATPTPDPDPPKVLPLENGNEMEEVKLCVRSVDLLSAQAGPNRTEHRTDGYHGDRLILRRGQTFQIRLELSRPFDAAKDKMHLDLKTVSSPVSSAKCRREI
ncbi:hypothetical protein CRUP_028877 [Coryphaenoides rupestris]|nr:hypothetical protein CRUP_028877 [Coryphaenoides rupestris]